MSAVSWTEYRCPHCDSEFSQEEIAVVHFTKKCPGCNGPVIVNAYECLGQSKAAAVLFVVFASLYVIVVSQIFELFGYSFEKINQMQSIYTYIVAFPLVALGAGFAFGVLKIYKKLFLRKIFNRLKKEGKI